MKEEKKKSFDIPPLVIYLTMFLLVLIIVLPPVLRMALPPLEEETELPLDKVALLKCTTVQDLEDYTLDIEAKANYQNDFLTKIILTYVLTMKETAPVDFVPDLGLAEYQDLSDVTVETDANTTKIIIDANAFTTNPSNVLLNQYQKNLKEQQQDLQALGYTCSVVNS